MRIWTGADGNSDFEEGFIDLSQTKGHDVLSTVAPAISISFRENARCRRTRADIAPVLRLQDIGSE